MIGAVPFVGQRHMSMESLYEYGSRVGVWRLFKLFGRKGIPLTVFGVAMALERNPAVAEAARITSYNVCYTKLLRHPAGWAG